MKCSRWMGSLPLVLALGCASPGGSSDGSSGSEGETSTGETGSATSDSAECNVYEQDCPEGEKCSWLWVDNDSAHRCVPATGSAAPGEPCHHDGAALGTDDCEAGSLCYGALSITEGWDGICTPICGGTPSDPLCEAAGTTCTLGNIPVCLPTCDPLLQDCEAGQSCWYTPNAHAFVCSLSANESGLAEPCIAGADCIAGLTCVEGSTVFGCTDPGCCTLFCELGVDACPDTDQGVECVDLMVGGEHADVGICQIPP